MADVGRMFLILAFVVAIYTTLISLFGALRKEKDLHHSAYNGIIAGAVLTTLAWGMLLHPTTLYIGYVGFSVPFAFAIAALITGRLGDEWIRSTRRWTIFAWFFLSLGNLFGAQWAYVELGWGGYWGWDPVESASFMPFLTGTAYLHSVMIQQRRGMLKVWNLVLIVTTFALTIFG